MQKMYWTGNGYPVLGFPADPNVALTVPSGEDGYSDPAGSDLATRAANWGWGDAYGDGAEGDAASGSMTPHAFRAASPMEIESTAFGTGYHHAFAAQNPNAESYVVNADLQWFATGPASVDPHPKYGIYAAYVDHDNHYGAWIDPVHRVVTTYAQINGSSGIDSAGESGWQNCSLPAGFSAGGPNRMRVFVDNNTFTVWLNDVYLSGPCQDRSFSSLATGQLANHLTDGQTGVVTENTKAQISNFHITRPAPSDGFFYHLLNRGTLHCLDNGYLGQGGSVAAVLCNAGITQNWQLHAKGSGFYTLTSMQNGLCLTNPRSGSDDNTQIQESCDGRPCQNWRLVPIEKGMYVLQNQGAFPAAGKPVLLGTGQSEGDSEPVNAEVQQHTASQQWSLELLN